VTDNQPRAASAYSVALEPTGAAKALTLGWAKGLITAMAALVGGSEQPAIGDLVVRRRSDDAEAMRTSSGDQEETAQLLEHVQRQLDELSVAEFEAAWDLQSESAGA
jgi:hypothetical protein